MYLIYGGYNSKSIYITQQKDFPIYVCILWFDQRKVLHKYLYRYFKKQYDNIFSVYSYEIPNNNNTANYSY